MGVWRRHRAAAGFLRLAVMSAAGALGACGLAGSAAAVSAAAINAPVPPSAGKPSTGKPGTGKPGMGNARTLVRERGAELARASARVTSLVATATALQTRAEVLTEDYDHEVTLAQQAAVAYQVAAGRLTVARRAAQRDSLRLAQQAAADYEADGGPGIEVVMLAGTLNPQAYLGALGIQQILASQRADLVAASQADEIVTRLFARQAATMLAQQRAASRSADDLKLAVVAAVSQVTDEVRLARASRSRLAAELARARASEAALAARGRAGRSTESASASASLPASVLAGGPSGAAPGVVAPDWSPDAGASVSQGEIAASWALTQLGKPYQWGGAGPGSYDCSGLAMDAWARAGVLLYHWTGFQWVSGPHVPLRQLRRGDLVFYATNVADPATIHHVGIYIGGGLMVDAPYTGASVRIDSIYAYPGLIGATRPASGGLRGPGEMGGGCPPCGKSVPGGTTA
jgi:cell wall-associated NlpC family hydrolase